MHFMEVRSVEAIVNELNAARVQYLIARTLTIRSSRPKIPAAVRPVIDGLIFVTSCPG